MDLLKKKFHLVGGISAVALAAYGTQKLKSVVSRSHAGPETLHEKISKAHVTGLRVAVIGCGISGIQAMKTCLADGIEPVCFEETKSAGGFWLYKENSKYPSVYRNVHIDTSRDLNSFGDRPYDINKPMFLHNTKVAGYLKDNIEEFKLQKYIRFNTVVTYVTPHEQRTKSMWTWRVTFVEKNTEGKNMEKTEIFDGVMICTGRHADQGYIPKFPGLSSFTKTAIHSSMYKYPSKHGFEGKIIVVVGCGNSGLDISTSLSPLVKQVYLVSRSGSWIFKGDHGDKVFSRWEPRLKGYIGQRIPWWWSSTIVEKVAMPSQHILNKHGMKPKHRFWQQHLHVSGLAAPTHSLHDELEAGRILVKKGIESFTSDGILFTGDKNPTVVDGVIFATGFRQACDFVDPKVVDMRFQRQGNDNPMYKGCLPISKYGGLCFVNFIQSATFMCAELQERLYTGVLNGSIKLPSLIDQKKDMMDTRDALCAQFMDRQQLRVQHGINMLYYDNLARLIGCFPSFWKLLRERPTAFWHAWITSWQPLQYRLVGPGRLEKAEHWLTAMHRSRMRIAKKHGIRTDNFVNYFIQGLQMLFTMSLVVVARLKGYYIGPELKGKLMQNLQYAAIHDDGKIGHAFIADNEAKDVINLGGKNGIFKNESEKRKA